MVSDVTSSTAGAALAIRQAQGQQSFGIQALSQSAKQESGVAELTAQAASGGAGGGNVTPTRGQNLNITV